MFFSNAKEDSLDNLITKNNRSLQELIIRIDVLEKEIQHLLDELNVTPEQVSEFIADKSNFTSENWDELNKQRRELEQKLSKEKNNISDPLKAKKTHSELAQVAPHWLFVK